MCFSSGFQSDDRGEEEDDNVVDCIDVVATEAELS